MVQNIDGSYTLVGITSWGYGKVAGVSQSTCRSLNGLAPVNGNLMVSGNLRTGSVCGFIQLITCIGMFVWLCGEMCAKMGEWEW